MEYTREEVLRSLRIIQDVCRNSSNCERCPLNKDDACGIKSDFPEDWNLPENEKPWKAFE